MITEPRFVFRETRNRLQMGDSDWETKKETRKWETRKLELFDEAGISR